MTRVAATAALFAIATGASLISQSMGRPITAAMLYLLGVTVVGATQGLVLGMVTAIAASLLYNFAITDPVLKFSIPDPDTLVPLLVFNACAIVSGTLAGRLRDRAMEAQQSARDLTELLESSKRFQSVITPDDLAEAIPAFDPLMKKFMPTLYFCNGSRMQLYPDRPLKACSVDTANCMATIYESADTISYPLQSSHGLLGALVLRPRGEALTESEKASIDAFVNMVGLALERCFLLDRVAGNQAIERSEAFKTALLSSVSHDVRTPLAAIRASAGGLKELSENMPPAVRDQLVTTITQQCDRLNRYLSDLLNLGLLQSGIDFSKMPVVDMIDILNSAIEGIAPIRGERNITRDVGDEPVFVRADAVLLQQVIHNILENAVDYSPATSRIDVTLTTSEKEARLTITDEGVGIPSASLERVFERFYRVERPGIRPHGTGLGLAIAKAFTEAVGGTIVAESPVRDGHGTRFIISVPVAARFP